jgi:hypothetical protein
MKAGEEQIDLLTHTCVGGADDSGSRIDQESVFA